MLRPFAAIMKDLVAALAVGCGRDGGYPPPPAQIRTCRITKAFT